jgi:hypothetical protein
MNRGTQEQVLVGDSSIKRAELEQKFILVY